MILEASEAKDLEAQRLSMVVSRKATFILREFRTITQPQLLLKSWLVLREWIRSWPSLLEPFSEPFKSRSGKPS